MTLSMFSQRFRAQMESQGSTRPAGLLRIILASLAMAKWAGHMTMDQISGPWYQMVFGLITLTSLLALLLGFYTRVASVVAGACAFGIAILGLNLHLRWTPIYSHHEACLALALCLLALLPSGGSYSLDRWRVVRNAERQGLPIPAEEGPMWAWPLLAIHVSVIYFYGAVIKVNMGYLSGDRLEQILMVKYFGSVLPQMVWFKPLMVVSAVGSMLLEFALCFGLWFRRFRWPLIAMGCAFHAFMYSTLTVYTFSMTMCSLYMAFFHPNEIDRELERIHGSRPRSTPSAPSGNP